VEEAMTWERVHFRLIQMPCCGHLFCNVNPRLPSFCPMCGKGCYSQVKSCVLLSDENAQLKYRNMEIAPRVPG